MFEINKVEINWAGKKLILETGRIARQADASVLATYGGTTVMANVVAAKNALYFTKILKMKLKLCVRYYFMIKKMTQIL